MTRISNSKQPKWLRPSAVFAGDALHTNLALEIVDGRCARVADITEIPAQSAILKSTKVACSGFFDLQINGGGGVMLNSVPTPEGVEKISAAHRASGTTSLLPTVITDTPEIIRKAALAVMECHGKFGVRGIHIEGPHINPERKGTHNPDLIRDFDQETMELLELLRAHGLPVLLTLAPEMVPSGTIAKLVKIGVVVSAGHTNATADQIEAALGEGLQMFTHLFNAMSQFTGREPGVVGSALASDAWCGIIADGYHVEQRTLNLAFAARPNDEKIFVVSDAMATWNGPEYFELYGERIFEKDGRLVNRNGSLAGAHIDMCHSFANLLAFGLPLETAIRACVSNPAKAMGLEVGFDPFLPYKTSPLVLFDPSNPVTTLEMIN